MNIQDGDKIGMEYHYMKMYIYYVLKYPLDRIETHFYFNKYSSTIKLFSV